MNIPNWIVLILLLVCFGQLATSESKSEVLSRLVFISGANDTITLFSDDIVCIDTVGNWFQVSLPAYQKLRGLKFVGGVVLVYKDSALCDVWSFMSYRKAAINRSRYIYIANDTIGFFNNRKIKTAGVDWSDNMYTWSQSVCENDSLKTGRVKASIEIVAWPSHSHWPCIYMGDNKIDNMDLSIKIICSDSLIYMTNKGDILSVSGRIMEILPSALDKIQNVCLIDCHVELWKENELLTKTDFLQEAGMHRVSIRGFFLLGESLLIVDDRYIIHQGEWTVPD